MTVPVDFGWSPRGEGTSYPPEPWYLGGTFHISAWLVPRQQVQSKAPEGTRLVALGGKAVLFTAWASYVPGGVLSYDEVLSAVLVRVNLKPAVTVTDIFVDSPQSAAGARALWGIPKRLATFETAMDTEFVATAAQGNDAFASFRFEPKRALPGCWSLHLQTAQRLDQRLKMTRFRALARIRFGRATWEFDRNSPFGLLNERRPLFSLRLERMMLRCGE